MRRLLGHALVPAVALVLALALTSTGFAQSNDSDEVLTNQNVTSMTKAGLSVQVIVAKIRSSKTDFDVSSNALIELKTAGVAEDVIAVMLNSANEPPAPGTRKRFTLNRAQPAPRGSAWYPARPNESGIYYLEEEGAEGKLVLVEPNVYTQSKETGAWKQALTYGVAKTRFKAVLPMAHARLTVDNRRPTFYFYFDVTSPSLSSSGTSWGPATSANEFILAELDGKKQSRELTVGDYGSLTGHNFGVDAKASRDFDYERLEPGVYKVTPKKDLPDGEYCFLYGGAVAANGTGAGPRLFDFAVRRAKT